MDRLMLACFLCGTDAYTPPVWSALEAEVLPLGVYFSVCCDGCKPTKLSAFQM